MSRLDEFLAHHVDKYLFYDIRFMERDDEAGGGVGYPMLMTCCAGIEFLGALRSRSRFQAHSKGSQYFTDYWQACLYPNPSAYNAYHTQVYQLVRHGIAHSFFTKGSIGVVRKRPALHFTRNADGLLLIDAVQLGRDLIASYSEHVKKVLSDPTRAAEKGVMETRLAEMEADFGAQAATHGAGFPAATSSGATGPAALITQSAAVSSATDGPTGPLPPKP